MRIDLQQVLKFIAFIILVNVTLLHKIDAKQSGYRHYKWSFSGFLGSYDQASVQRGYWVYRKHCASCHAIKEMRYADLQQAGLTLEQIGKIAQQDHLLDGKDAQGQDHYRTATVKDFLVAPYFNEEMAKAANHGKLPVDFSRYMMTKKDGADYVMALLLGYRSPPKDFKFNQQDSYYNLYTPQHQIGMKPPFVKDDIRNHNGTSASVEQQARDVVTFLSWTAHPHLIERHRIGVMIFLYMLFITVLVFLINRKVWSNVKK